MSKSCGFIHRHRHIRNEVGHELGRRVHRVLEEVDHDSIEAITQSRETPECLLERMSDTDHSDM